MPPCKILTFLMFVMAATPSSAQESPAPVVLEVRHGFTGEGNMTAEWRQAIAVWYSGEGLDSLARNRKPLLPNESAWAQFITRRIPAWAMMIDSLSIPFGTAPRPDTVTILFGNQGGNDAFVYAPSTICFDLSRLAALYGNSASPQNANRMDRFFAHEMTHLLHKAWARKYEVRIQTPFEFALWDCLTEGLGNYRSLSDKWVDPKGKWTDHARDVLKKLQPVFVDRLARLQHASGEQAEHLLEGLSMGPFEQKWGALTVALWLAREAAGNDRNLQKWVNRGPQGILELARKYLPPDLRDGLPDPGN